MSERAPSCTVGVDVGGTHVAVAVADAAGERLVAQSRVRRAVNSSAAAHVILDGWCDAIRESVKLANAPAIAGIGVAMPGPFDYERGISRLRGLEKFDDLFGVNVRLALRWAVAPDRPARVVFRNDAECFALGEAWLGAGRGAKRIVAVTLGTGLGSAFIADGAPVTVGDSVPPSGWLYCVPFDGAPAEEHFSARGLLRRYAEASGSRVQDVAELARLAHDPSVAAAFEEYGRRLGEFLAPHAERFGADRVVVGGSIAKAWDLFSGSLPRSLAVEVRPAELFEDAALCGAARLAQAWPGGSGGSPQRREDIDSLADELDGQRRATIECTEDEMDVLSDRLDVALRRRGRRPVWYDTRAAAVPGDLEHIRPDPAAPLSILIGPGAAGAGWKATLL